MPIDPRIPLGVQPVQFPSPLEIYSNVQQIQGIREQTELRRLAAEEARQRRVEAQEQRSLAQQVEAALQSAITVDPQTQQPTVDWAKLTGGRLPAATLFKVKEEVDQAATRAQTLRTARMTADEKVPQYLGTVIAPPIRTGNYDPALWQAGIVTAQKAGALTPQQAEHYLAVTDPAEIKRLTDEAIKAAAKATEGFTLSSGQVRYSPTGEVVARGEAKPPGEGTKFQDTDAIVKFPNGETYTGKVGYNPDLNVYAPIGSTTPFPEGTTVEKQPTPVDPLVAAIRGLTVNTLREQAATMTPAQATYAKALADDYTKASEDYIVRAQSHQTLKGAADNPSAAGDIVMIFAFMRQQDPKSTVREGEYATAQNAAGVPEQIRNLYNRVVSGERLTATQRADFVGQSERIFKSAQQRQRGLYKIYAKRAENMKLNPADVVIDYDELFGVAAPAETRTTPAGGAPATPKKNPFGPK